MKFKRFTKPSFLKEIGRELLGRFFERFNEDLAAKNIVLPATNLEGDAYFQAMSQVAISPVRVISRPTVKRRASWGLPPDSA